MEKDRVFKYFFDLKRNYEAMDQILGLVLKLYCNVQPIVSNDGSQGYGKLTQCQTSTARGYCRSLPNFQCDYRVMYKDKAEIIVEVQRRQHKGFSNRLECYKSLCFMDSMSTKADEAKTKSKTKTKPYPKPLFYEKLLIPIIIIFHPGEDFEDTNLYGFQAMSQNLFIISEQHSPLKGCKGFIANRFNYPKKGIYQLSKKINSSS